MDKTVVGVIGAGPWGKNHVRVYHELKEVELKLVADLDESRLSQMKEKHGVATTRDYHDILNDSKIKAVSICVPASAHYKLTKEALLAGKDVLVEKPFTLDSKQAQELVDLSGQEKKTLAVGQVFRYDPAIAMIKEKIREGLFGKIYYLSLSRLGLKQPRSDVGAIFNYAVHDLDIMCDVLNQNYPKEITAVATYPLEREYEDLSVIVARFDNGTLGYTQVSWLTPKKYRDFWLIGEKRSANIDSMNHEAEVYESGIVPEYQDFKTFRHITKEGKSYKLIPERKEPLKEELLDFITSAKKGGVPRASGEVGLRTIKMVEAAIKSAAEKRTISLNENGDYD